MRVARLLAAVLTLIAAAAVVYRPALSAYFFDDDFQWLVGSWSFHPARLVAFADMNHFYRPVIDAYFGVATPAFGGSPTLFHLASIVLHAVNGLLVLGFANRISGNLAFGFLSALFFVVQPAHIDAVAWVGAIGEPLSVCFGLIALLGLLEFRRTGLRRWHLLSVTAFLLALLTHESAVMFLPLLVLTAHFFAREDPSAGARTGVAMGAALRPVRACRGGLSRDRSVDQQPQLCRLGRALRDRTACRVQCARLRRGPLRGPA